VLTFIYILSFIFFLREKRGHLWAVHQLVL
jgi:hypothetical protein